MRKRKWLCLLLALCMLPFAGGNAASGMMRSIFAAPSYSNSKTTLTLGQFLKENTSFSKSDDKIGGRKLGVTDQKGKSTTIVHPDENADPFALQNDSGELIGLVNEDRANFVVTQNGTMMGQGVVQFGVGIAINNHPDVSMLMTARGDQGSAAITLQSSEDGEVEVLATQDDGVVKEHKVLVPSNGKIEVLVSDMAPVADSIKQVISSNELLKLMNENKEQGGGPNGVSTDPATPHQLLSEACPSCGQSYPERLANAHAICRACGRHWCDRSGGSHEVDCGNVEHRPCVLGDAYRHYDHESCTICLRSRCVGDHSSCQRSIEALKAAADAKAAQPPTVTLTAKPLQPPTARPTAKPTAKPAAKPTPVPICVRCAQPVNNGQRHEPCCYSGHYACEPHTCVTTKP